MAIIMVLNDGETFTTLDGCRMIQVPDDWDTDQIEKALHEDFGDPEPHPNLMVLCEFQ